MAWTDTQRVDIYLSLGYAQDEASVTIPGIDSLVDAASSDAARKTKIESLLSRIDSVETQLDESILRAGVLKVDTIELQPGSSMSSNEKHLLARGRHLCSQVQSLVGAKEGPFPRFGIGSPYSFLLKGA